MRVRNEKKFFLDFGVCLWSITSPFGQDFEKKKKLSEFWMVWVEFIKGYRIQDSNKKDGCLFW